MAQRVAGLAQRLQGAVVVDVEGTPRDGVKRLRLVDLDDREFVVRVRVTNGQGWLEAAE